MRRPGHCFLASVLREVRVCLHFLDLIGVALAVRPDEQDKLVGIPLATDGTVNGMLAKARRSLEKIFGLGPALNEVADRALRGTEPVGRL